MILRVQDIVFRYPSSHRTALDGISFNVDEGSYLSVLGENGCGKSTLVKLILGLLTPTGGSIQCTAKRIGYVPQQKTSFFQLPLTVAELIAAARKSQHLKTSFSTDEVLDLVGVASKKNELLGNLSGGELQRVFIAQAILGKPELLILDEPSTAVDITGQEKLYGLISRLNKENHITIIAVEHNLQAAMHNSTEIFHLADGNGHLCTPQQYASEYLVNNIPSKKF